MDNWTYTMISSHIGQRNMLTALFQHQKGLLSTEDTYQILIMNISLLRSLILEKEGRLLQFTEAYYNEQWRSRTIFHSSYRQQRHYGRTSICVHQNGRESSLGYKEQLSSVRLLNSICNQETFPFSASLFQLENLIFFTHLPDLLFWSNMVPVSFP